MIRKTAHAWQLFLCTLALFLSSLVLPGCAKVKHPISKTGIYFDTLITITLYENNSSELIDNCFKLAEKYENLLSKTVINSDVYKINNSYNEWINIDKNTYDVIKTGLQYEDLCDGRFSIVCGTLVDLWDVTNRKEMLDNNFDKSKILPSEEEINTAIMLCGKKNIEIDDNNLAVKVVTKGSKIDLGAVAKGFIADEMKSYLLSQGVENGIIQLGGNVLLIGNNPTKDNGLYTIGINEPFSEDNKVITAVNEKDVSIVTSGNYQRYFEYGGKKYHHIIDLTTGYPADTGLNSVTIICDKSIDADCLSTLCFLYGENDAKELLDTLNNQTNGTNIKAIFVDENNKISNY